MPKAKVKQKIQEKHASSFLIRETFYMSIAQKDSLHATQKSAFSADTEMNMRL
jgi:hypothetical protein